MRMLVCLAAMMLFSTSIVASAAERQSFAHMSEDMNIEANKRFFTLELDPVLFSTLSPDLRDLRLFSGEQELGYARLPEELAANAPVRQETAVEMINEGSFPDGSYGFTVKLGNLQEKPDALRIQLSGEPYVVKGELFGSSDNATWQKLRPITLFGIEGRTNELDLAGIEYPYLRILLAKSNNREHDAAGVYAIIAKEATGTVNGNEWTPSFSVTHVQPKETMALADLIHPHAVSSVFSIRTKESGFHRRVVLEGSHTRTENWELIQSSYLYRGLDATDEWLSVSYPPVSYRFLRLRIADEDNAPIPIDSVTVRTYPVRLLVKAPANVKAPFPLKSYWGNPELSAPSYDVSEFLTQATGNRPDVVMRYGQQNPDYQGPPLEEQPFTERFPFLLPGILIAAVIAVGYMLVRTMKHVNGPR